MKIVKLNNALESATIIAHASKYTTEDAEVLLEDTYCLGKIISRTIKKDIIKKLLNEDHIFVRYHDDGSETREFIELSREHLIEELYELNRDVDAKQVYERLGLAKDSTASRLTEVAQLIRDTKPLAWVLDNIEYIYNQYIYNAEEVSGKFADKLASASGNIADPEVIKEYFELTSSGHHYFNAYSKAEFYVARSQNRVFDIQRFFNDMTHILEGSGFLTKNNLFYTFNKVTKETAKLLLDKIFDLVKLEDEASADVLTDIVEDEDIVNLLMMGITKFDSARAHKYWEITKHLLETTITEEGRKRRTLGGEQIGFKSLIFADNNPKTPEESVQQVNKYANTEFPFTKNIDGTDFTSEDLETYRKIYEEIFGIYSIEYLAFIACNDIVNVLYEEFILNNEAILNQYEHYTQEARRLNSPLLKSGFSSLAGLVKHIYGTDIKAKAEEYIKLGIVAELPDDERSAVANLYNLNVNDIDMFIDGKTLEIIQEKNSTYKCQNSENIEPSNYFNLLLLHNCLYSYSRDTSLENVFDPARKEELDAALTRLLNQAIKKAVIMTGNNPIINKRYLNMLIGIIHEDTLINDTDEMKDVGRLIAEIIVKHVLPNKVKRELIFGYNKKMVDGETTSTNAEHRIVEGSMRELFGETKAFSFNQICGASSSELSDHILASGEELDKHLMAQFTKESLV